MAAAREGFRYASVLTRSSAPPSLTSSAANRFGLRHTVHILRNECEWVDFQLMGAVRADRRGAVLCAGALALAVTKAPQSP